MNSYAVKVRLPSGNYTELKIDAINGPVAREIAEAQYGKGTVVGGPYDYKQSSTSVFEEKAKADQEWSDRQRAESQSRATQYSSSSVSAPSVSVPQWSNRSSSSSYSTSSDSSSSDNLGEFIFYGGVGYRMLMGTVTTAVAFAMPGEFNWLVALSGFVAPLLITYIAVIALLIAAWPTIVAIAKAIMSITLVGVLKVIGVFMIVFAVVFCVVCYYAVPSEQEQPKSE